MIGLFDNVQWRNKQKHLKGILQIDQSASWSFN